jgi:hypothetical protein
MNTSEIEVLLEKYYEGTTSLQEEKVLRDFFQHKFVPAHLESHQKIFGYFSEERRQELNLPDFDQKITKKLDNQYIDTPVIRIQQHKNRFVFITGIAAGILILVGLFFTLKQDLLRKETPVQFTINQEINFAVANEALLIVSSNLNAGLRQADRLQVVDKAMKNLQLFNRFYQYQTIIINPDEIQQKSPNSK